MITVGSKVKMNDKYYVADKNKDKVFEVASKPWNVGGTMVVKLKDYPSCYALDGLTEVE